MTHSSLVCVGCQASAVGCESGTFWKGTTVRTSPSAAAHPAAVAATETGGDGDGGGGDGEGEGEPGGSKGDGGLCKIIATQPCAVSQDPGFGEQP